MGDPKKVAVVTAGAGGIGAAITRRMVQDNYAVAVLDMDLRGAEALAAELRGQGGEAEAIPCDVALAEEIQRGFDRVMERFGRIDVLANNAGAGGFLPWLEDVDKGWRHLYAVNCDGVFLCVQRAAREMIRAGIRGKIIITLSCASYIENADALLYYASKWGARGLMRCAAEALMPHGIAVNGVCPGVVWTPMLERFCNDFVASGAGTREEFAAKQLALFPNGRFQQPEDIAAVYSFLLREGHHISGQSLLVTGGFCFA